MAVYFACKNLEKYHLQCKDAERRSLIKILKSVQMEIEIRQKKILIRK